LKPFIQKEGETNKTWKTGIFNAW